MDWAKRRISSPTNNRKNINMIEGIPPDTYWDDELDLFYHIFEFYGLPAKSFENIYFTQKWIGRKDEFPKLPKTEKTIV
jgi:hypothetical protein